MSGAPHRTNLLEYFDSLASSPGIFMSYDDGYRRRSYTYTDVTRAARAFAGRLHDAGVRPESRVLLWGENRPEWIAAFWGCLLAGAVVVPIDYRASRVFVDRVRTIVDAALLLVGADVAPSVDVATSVDGAPADEAEPSGDVWRLTPFDWNATASSEVLARLTEIRRQVTSDSTAEIIFTSGATADPKGVVITHGNVLANVEPVEREVRKYRRYGRPFYPLRFMNLLPLSHMFGQAMATFVPPMIPGEVVFVRGYNPADIVMQIRERRVSVLVCVPKMLDVLGDHVARHHPEVSRESAGDQGHWAVRWWRYRAVHREFGLKFWCFIVGAAPLEADMEAFWSRLGFLVVQGYGLTETAPIVSLNHPFHTRRGSVGQALGGVEVKIAPDGEILVRGDNVTKGYYRAPEETARAFEDGWFHTGDIGELDETGQLFIRGRKKEMIVTPEGLNVFPEDVERVLNGLTGVHDSAVVGVTRDGQERVHAVLVLEPDTLGERSPEDAADEIVRRANAQLGDHQRIRGARVWPGDRLPRTEGTAKLKRRQLKQWLETGLQPPAATPQDATSLDALLGKYAGGRPITPDLTLEGLGLSSLERIELMVALEEAFETRIDESAFTQATTVADLRRLLISGPGGGSAGRGVLPGPGAKESRAARDSGAASDGDWEFPAWNTSAPARAVRRVSLATWLLPLTRVFAWVRVEGLDQLAGLRGPALFAANHQSHLDTPVILAALPSRFRYRLATAMAKEFFHAHFHRRDVGRVEYFTNSLNYYLSTLFFNAFPLPQREAGARQTLRYIGTLLGKGHSVLIFPEGRRTQTGEIDTFRPGIGMMASRLQAPVVPVRLEGIDRVLHPSWKMARPGRVTVTFGRPIDPAEMEGLDYAAIASRVESAVKAL